MTDNELFNYMNNYEDDELEAVEGGEFGEDCPVHLEHTAIMENDNE